MKHSAVSVVQVNRPKFPISLQAGASWHQRVRLNVNKRIQILGDGRVPAKDAKTGTFMDKKRRITRKEYRRLWNEFETGAFMAQKGLWNVAREKMVQDRGASLKEERDTVREYKAMYEDNFLSSWLREGERERKWPRRPEKR